MDDHQCFAARDEYDQISPARRRMPIHARRCYHGRNGAYWEVYVRSLKDGRTSASVFGSGGDLYTHPEHCTPKEAVAHLNGLVDTPRFPLDDELRDLMLRSPIGLVDDDGATQRVAEPLYAGQAAATLADALFASYSEGIGSAPGTLGCTGGCLGAGSSSVALS